LVTFEPLCTDSNRPLVALRAITPPFTGLLTVFATTADLHFASNLGTDNTPAISNLIGFSEKGSPRRFGTGGF